jgi:hypothetical protein
MEKEPTKQSNKKTNHAKKKKKNRAKEINIER